MATHSFNTPAGVNDTGLPAVPIDIEVVISHLAMRPQEAEAFIAGLAHALIEEQDRLDTDPDLEPSFGYLPHGAMADECEPDVDDEPSLGAPEVELGFRCLPDRRGHIDQRRWCDGGTVDDDAETVNEDGGDINDEPHDDDELDNDGLAQGERDDSDSEPSLGATESINQVKAWKQDHRQGEDYEHDGLGDTRENRESFSAARYASRAAAREQARALLGEKCRRALPTSDVVELRPGVLQIRGGRNV